ncbi:hypothetical protein JY651_02310 [Pyxidicoccus parkwayensis]|uniref:Lipoprotein n=1 Tax=Pyxidicoccus parkwayensis TaxID=2813578 RepID=A0ABX7P1M8_9BACT|nr:hypothetical protein [Pyxidicoccus parkwaysis]QSQ23839.1 hypothetical protein JY651_02310 [Pyxidicoccus parkwaysis]
MMSRACVIAALSLALAWAPEAQAGEAVALIWKGAKNKADVESLEPAWTQLSTLLSDGGVAIPEGFPKLVQSNTVRGLKPGFWVWVVGFCPSDDSVRALELLKLVAPDTYARDVQLPAKSLACPDVSAASLQADSHEFKLSGGRVLRVLTYDESSAPEGDEPGDSYTRTHYVFLLTDKKGAVLDTASAVGEEQFSGDPRNGPSNHRCQVSELEQKKGGAVELIRNCSAGAAECGSLMSADEVTLIKVSGDTLMSTESRRNEEYMECEGD